MNPPVPEASARMQIDVPADQDGVRLDAFLTSALPDRSRSQIQKLIKDGHVTGPLKACLLYTSPSPRD